VVIIQNKRGNIMKAVSRSQRVSDIISLVFRAVALAMGVAALVMSILGVADADTLVILLSIGLFTLALDALDRGPEPE
jgi:energy-converting hydrogenase Eha subunit A